MTDHDSTIAGDSTIASVADRACGEALATSVTVPLETALAGAAALAKSYRDQLDDIAYADTQAMTYPALEFLRPPVTERRDIAERTRAHLVALTDGLGGTLAAVVRAMTTADGEIVDEIPAVPAPPELPPLSVAPTAALEDPRGMLEAIASAYGDDASVVDLAGDRVGLVVDPPHADDARYAHVAIDVDRTLVQLDSVVLTVTVYAADGSPCVDDLGVDVALWTYQHGRTEDVALNLQGAVSAAFNRAVDADDELDELDHTDHTDRRLCQGIGCVYGDH